MLKKLTDAIQFFIYQKISIAIINFTNERTCFFSICESISINIESIIISAFIFVIEKLNYKFFLKRFFQNIVRMSAVNINNNSLKIILYSLNNKKRVNFLKVLAKYFSNKKIRFRF